MKKTVQVFDTDFGLSEFISYNNILPSKEMIRFIIQTEKKETLRIVIQIDNEKYETKVKSFELDYLKFRTSWINFDSSEESLEISCTLFDQNDDIVEEEKFIYKLLQSEKDMEVLLW